MRRALVILFILFHSSNYCFGQKIKEQIKETIWNDLMLINNNYNNSIFSVGHTENSNRDFVIIEDMESIVLDEEFDVYKVKVSFSVIFDVPYLFEENLLYTIILDKRTKTIYKIDGFLLSQMRLWYSKYLLFYSDDTKSILKALYKFNLWKKKDIKILTKELISNKKHKSNILTSAILNKYYKEKGYASILLIRNSLLR